MADKKCHNINIIAGVNSDSDKCKSVFYQKKTSTIRQNRRAAKNLNRRRRRKRSITRYYRNLRHSRRGRNTDDLCESVSVVDISDVDMECVQTKSSLTLDDRLGDVSDWHKQEQIAYWKSRALSLEIENRMLLIHIQDFYAYQIQEASGGLEAKCFRDTNVDKGSNNDTVKEISPSGKGDVPKIASGGTEAKGFRDTNVDMESNNDKVKEVSQSGKGDVPKIEENIEIESRKDSAKERREEMKKMYGSMAPKIMGMETALQLNYDYQLDDLKAPHWPVLPIKMNFDE